MKKLIIFTYLSLTIMVGCKAQTSNTTKNNIKKSTMTYLNMDDFKKGSYTNQDGDFIHQFKGSGEIDYILHITKKSSPITRIKAFFEKSKSLKSTGQIFDDFAYGFWKEYDENGKLIKETDHDKDYPFKVEDLCKLIKEEYGVDLMVITSPKSNNDLQYSVERRYLEELKKHCYVVIFQYPPPDEGYNSRLKEVYIDGKTGKFIYEDGWTLGDLPKSKTPIPQKKM